MSIVNTETLQADKLVAKDGKDDTQVAIPSLGKNMAFAKVIFPPNNKPMSAETFNVSSVTIINDHGRTVNLITPRVFKDGVTAWAVTAFGNDAVTNNYLDIYHKALLDTSNKVNFDYYIKGNPALKPNVSYTDIVIF